MDDLAARVVEAFRDRYGRWPDGVWQAPGRVNLIGDHTDYNGGLALPFAIDRGLVVAAARRPDRIVRAWSAQDDDVVEAETDSLLPGSPRGWGKYPLGVLWAFGQAGVDLPGFDLAIDSTLPLGGGLSSSAALGAAVALAVDALVGADLGARQLATMVHRSETGFVLSPVGMLDPLAVLGGRRDHALFIDFEDLSVEAVPLTIGPLVVVDSGVRHDTAGEGYATRRQECRDAVARRLRHVASENERVREAVRRLRNGQAIGDVLFASHTSLRHDFEVSCPELDAIVEVVAHAGADGARLTGAGFGGCVIVLGLSAAELNAALEGSGLSPRAFEVKPSDGAGRVS